MSEDELKRLDREVSRFFTALTVIMTVLAAVATVAAGWGITATLGAGLVVGTMTGAFQNYLASKLRNYLWIDFWR
jgi:ABC-type xylose transport system permease subunit